MTYDNLKRQEPTKKKKKEELTEKPNSVQYGDFSYGQYTESDAVKAAKDKLDSIHSAKPGEYVSTHQKELDAIMDKIDNREKFHYDLNGDVLYNQYKNRYTENAEKAMEDTVGKASSMTGGYGNSYAVTAGQNAYAEQIKKGNDVIPELYRMAYDVYENEGKQLQDAYRLKNEEEKAAYAKYQDLFSRWEKERANADSMLQKEKDRDYGRYQDEKELAYDAYVKARKEAYDSNRDAIADQKWREEMDAAAKRYAEKLAYEKQRDTVSDNRWLAEFEESKNRYAAKEKYDRERDEAEDTLADAKLQLEREKYENDLRKQGITKDVTAFEKAISGAGDLYEAEKYTKAFAEINPHLAREFFMDWLRKHADREQQEVDPYEKIVRDLPERKRDFFYRQLAMNKKRYKK